MKKFFVLMPLALLTACQTAKVPEPIIKTVFVSVPGKALPCVPKELGPAPVYVDTNEKLKSAADAAERYQLIFAGRMQREARLGEIEPVISSCPKD